MQFDTNLQRLRDIGIAQDLKQAESLLFDKRPLRERITHFVTRDSFAQLNHLVDQSYSSNIEFYNAYRRAVSNLATLQGKSTQEAEKIADKGLDTMYARAYEERDRLMNRAGCETDPMTTRAISQFLQNDRIPRPVAHAFFRHLLASDIPSNYIQDLFHSIPPSEVPSILTNLVSLSEVTQWSEMKEGSKPKWEDYVNNRGHGYLEDVRKYDTFFDGKDFEKEWRRERFCWNKNARRIENRSTDFLKDLTKVLQDIPPEYREQVVSLIPKSNLREIAILAPRLHALVKQITEETKQTVDKVEMTPEERELSVKQGVEDMLKYVKTSKITESSIAKLSERTQPDDQYIAMKEAMVGRPLFPFEKERLNRDKKLTEPYTQVEILKDLKDCHTVEEAKKLIDDLKAPASEDLLERFYAWMLTIYPENLSLFLADARPAIRRLQTLLGRTESMEPAIEKMCINCLRQRDYNSKLDPKDTEYTVDLLHGLPSEIREIYYQFLLSGTFSTELKNTLKGLSKSESREMLEHVAKLEEFTPLENLPEMIQLMKEIPPDQRDHVLYLLKGIMQGRIELELRAIRAPPRVKEKIDEAIRRKFTKQRLQHLIKEQKLSPSPELAKLVGGTVPLAEVKTLVETLTPFVADLSYEADHSIKVTKEHFPTIFPQYPDIGQNKQEAGDLGPQVHRAAREQLLDAIKYISLLPSELETLQNKVARAFSDEELVKLFSEADILEEERSLILNQTFSELPAPLQQKLQELFKSKVAPLIGRLIQESKLTKESHQAETVLALIPKLEKVRERLTASPWDVQNALYPSGAATIIAEISRGQPIENPEEYSKIVEQLIQNHVDAYKEKHPGIPEDLRYQTAVYQAKNKLLASGKLPSIEEAKEILERPVFFDLTNESQ